MTQENRQKLETFRHIFVNRAGSANDDLNVVLNIIREEWDAHYSVDMWCDACKMKMIDYAFIKMSLE